MIIKSRLFKNIIIKGESHEDHDVKAAKIGTTIVIGGNGQRRHRRLCQIESNKDYVMPLIPYFKSMIIGHDPTDVESVLRQMRRSAAFKPGKCSAPSRWPCGILRARRQVFRSINFGRKSSRQGQVYNGSFGSQPSARSR